MSAVTQARIDVMLEVDKMLMEQLGRHGAARYALEKLRDKADEEARAVGGHVITDRKPEVVLKEGQSYEHGNDVILLGARFWVDVPVSFEVTSRNHVAVVGSFGTSGT